MLATPDLGGSAFTLAVAALFATVRGRRWHREDLEAGADLADLAAAPARSAGSAALARPNGGAAPSRDPGCREIGSVARGCCSAWTRATARCRSRSAASSDGRHTLVVGATGSGKTVTQTWIAVRAIEHGMGAIVVDPKGDGGMREEVRRAALAAGRSFLEWTPER